MQSPERRRPTAATLVCAAVLAFGAAGCGEDTPEFGELTQPADEEAVPLEEKQMEMTAEERAEAQAEAAQRMERRENQDLAGEQPAPEEPETAPQPEDLETAP